jgi:uncharacterized protein
MVAPADVDSARHTPEHLRDFAPLPLRRFPFRSMVIASTNDRYMTIGRARALAAAWGALFVDVGACGHINTEAGFGPWLAGRSLLDEFISGQELCRRQVAGGAPSSDAFGIAG